MKVYVDDIRNPVNHLSTEQSDGIVWLKEWWEARNYIFNNKDDIEVLHFDNFLGDPNQRTGSDILSKVVYRLSKGEFPKLKQIYLHSSDTDVVNKQYDNQIERCTNAGVELIKNSRPNRS